jgi:acetyltransferase
LQDPRVDGLLTILTPQAMTDPLAAAEQVVAISRTTTKPVFACWLGQREVAAARELFAREGIPAFTSPESALHAFSCQVRNYEGQQQLRQDPDARSVAQPADDEGAR